MHKCVDERMVSRILLIRWQRQAVRYYSSGWWWWTEHLHRKAYLYVKRHPQHTVNIRHLPSYPHEWAINEAQATSDSCSIDNLFDLLQYNAFIYRFATAAAQSELWQLLLWSLLCSWPLLTYKQMKTEFLISSRLHF